MRRLRSSLAWIAGLLAAAHTAAALAGTPVTLRANPSSGPTITLADLFDGAGAAGQAYVGGGAPPGLDAVLDAGAVQRIAHMNGLDWANTDGLRRIIVH
ncbi:MAG: flagella basal body P-ring formation protein FlgA, partial [Caulobacteraceae bacterium]|nr:flagella basal body P-ring formation protein FlgA [Caulobacteraceae bacterium]